MKKEYISTFEDRINKSADNFIFCEVYGDSIKKIRTDFLDETEK